MYVYIFLNSAYMLLFIFDLDSGMHGEFLNISKVSRLNMAAYLCIASNGVQPSVSKRMMLNVKCK